MNFPHGIVADSAPEDSTRGRSFLFFASAALAASGFKPDSRIQVPENGLIALNAPLDQLHLGSSGGHENDSPVLHRPLEPATPNLGTAGDD